MLLFYYLLIGILGASWGSFLLVLYERRLVGKSIIFPPSHCSNCSTPLPYYCLFPIVSYWSCRGRCVFCDVSIPTYSVILEILSALFFLTIVPTTSPTPFSFICFFILSYLAVEDVAVQSVSTHLLIFPAYLLVKFNFSWLNFAILLILTFLLFNNLEHLACFQKIGQGDIEILLFFTLLVGAHLTTLIILIAATLGATVLFFTKKSIIPFIPYLFTAYYLLMFVFQ